MRLLQTLLFFTVVSIFLSCRHKSGKSSAEARKIEPEEFRGMFHGLKLPLTFGDSSLSRKPTDSALSRTVFSQFISDSLLQKNFGKSGKPTLYAVGKLVVKKAETYLLIKALTPAKKILYVACLDAEGVFKTGMPILVRDEDSDLKYAATIDSKYAISVSRLHKGKDGKSLFARTVYVYNSEGVFTLIMRESNEGKPRTGAIYNPVDTLPHKHKFTGDYLQDPKNFISFRDGKNNTILRFFVHFEKDDGNCKGELKGEAKMVSPTVARYSANGDPCSVEFSFTDKTVRMKELEGCGNHRDIRCYFEGIYNKHKEAEPKPVKGRKPGKVK